MGNLRGRGGRSDAGLRGEMGPTGSPGQVSRGHQKGNTLIGKHESDFKSNDEAKVIASK